MRGCSGVAATTGSRLAGWGRSATPAYRACHRCRAGRVDPAVPLGLDAPVADTDRGGCDGHAGSALAAVRIGGGRECVGGVAPTDTTSRCCSRAVRCGQRGARCHPPSSCRDHGIWPMSRPHALESEIRSRRCFSPAPYQLVNRPTVKKTIDFEEALVIGEWQTSAPGVTRRHGCRSRSSLGVTGDPRETTIATGHAVRLIPNRQMRREAQS